MNQMFFITNDRKIFRDFKTLSSVKVHFNDTFKSHVTLKIGKTQIDLSHIKENKFETYNKIAELYSCLDNLDKDKDSKISLENLIDIIKKYDADFKLVQQYWSSEKSALLKEIADEFAGKISLFNILLQCIYKEHTSFSEKERDFVILNNSEKTLIEIVEKFTPIKSIYTLLIEAKKNYGQLCQEIWTKTLPISIHKFLMDHEFTLNNKKPLWELTVKKDKYNAVFQLSKEGMEYAEKVKLSPFTELVLAAILIDQTFSSKESFDGIKELDSQKKKFVWETDIWNTIDKYVNFQQEKVPVYYNLFINEKINFHKVVAWFEGIIDKKCLSEKEVREFITEFCKSDYKKYKKNYPNEIKNFKYCNLSDYEKNLLVGFYPEAIKKYQFPETICEKAIEVVSDYSQAQIKKEEFNHVYETTPYKHVQKEVKIDKTVPRYVCNEKLLSALVTHFPDYNWKHTEDSSICQVDMWNGSSIDATANVLIVKLEDWESGVKGIRENMPILIWEELLLDKIPERYYAVMEWGIDKPLWRIFLEFLKTNPNVEKFKNYDLDDILYVASNIMPHSKKASRYREKLITYACDKPEILIKHFRESLKEQLLGEKTRFAMTKEYRNNLLYHYSGLSTDKKLDNEKFELMSLKLPPRAREFMYYLCFGTKRESVFEKDVETLIKLKKFIK